MIRKTLLIGIAILLATGVADVALAQERTQLLALAGYAKSTDPRSPSGSIGGLVALYRTSYGPTAGGFEVGYYSLGDFRYDGVDQESMQAVPVEVGLNVLQLTLNGTVTIESGSFRPYGKAGFGFYVTETTIPTGVDVSAIKGGTRTLPGFNLGVGLQIGKDRSNIALVVDGRWHNVFEYYSNTGALDYLAIMGGIRVTLAD